MIGKYCCVFPEEHETLNTINYYGRGERRKRALNDFGIHARWIRNSMQRTTESRCVLKNFRRRNTFVGEMKLIS